MCVFTSIYTEKHKYIYTHINIWTYSWQKKEEIHMTSTILISVVIIWSQLVFITTFFHYLLFITSAFNKHLGCSWFFTCWCNSTLHFWRVWTRLLGVFHWPLSQGTATLNDALRDLLYSRHSSFPSLWCSSTLLIVLPSGRISLHYFPSGMPQIGAVVLQLCTLMWCLHITQSHL